jgi:SAM-dependent methyltransferase
VRFPHCAAAFGGALHAGYGNSNVLPMPRDARLSAPAADRNKEPILAVLRRVLPQTGLVCEIASGTGQHVAHFAAALPHLTWQPSEPDARLHASIAAWIAYTGLTNVRSPVRLDVCADEWPLDSADAILCINMIHIAPWDATLALMRGAARLLGVGGVLFLYGPYRRDGAHTAPSNEAFDASLRASDPAWGVRDMEAVVAVAGEHGFVLSDVVAMPANNFSVVFSRVGKGA